MRVKIGSTRIVFLVGNIAIKFARICPLRFLFIMIAFPFTSKVNRENFYKKYGKNLKIAFKRCVFIGFYSNAMEFKFYKKHQNETRIVSTRKMLLNYFIVIQPRGLPVTQEVLQVLNPFKDLPNLRHHEVNIYWQFCKINNKILLADYGYEETCKLLIKTAI